MSTAIIHGDCLEELKKLEDCSVDADCTKLIEKRLGVEE